MNLISKQNIYFWLIVVFLLLLEIPVVLWMQRTTENQGKTKEETPDVKTLAEALGLNNKQLIFFDANNREYSNVIAALHQSIINKNKEIADKIFKKDYDGKNVNQLIEDVGSLNEEVDKVRFKYLQKISSVLNLDQLNKFKVIINQSLIEWNDTLIVPYNENYPPRPRRIL